MDTTNYRRFFQQRLDLARWIITEKGNGFEADAEIILCCALGALAAKLWPGTGIDRQRFTQLLVDFSTPEANFRTISTPVLAWQLRDKGDVSSAINLANHFFPGHPTEVLQPAIVDQDESIIAHIFNHLEKKVLRRASYASIIYGDLRCGLIHEYDISPPITSIDLFEISDVPSYINMRYDDGHTRRLLHIPFSYLVKVLGSVAESLFLHWNNSTEWEKPRPLSWWIDA